MDFVKNLTQTNFSHVFRPLVAAWKAVQIALACTGLPGILPTLRHFSATCSMTARPLNDPCSREVSPRVYDHLGFTQKRAKPCQ